MSQAPQHSSTWKSRMIWQLKNLQHFSMKTKKMPKPPISKSKRLVMGLTSTTHNIQALKRVLLIPSRRRQLRILRSLQCIKCRPKSHSCSSKSLWDPKLSKARRTPFKSTALKDQTLSRSLSDNTRWNQTTTCLRSKSLMRSKTPMILKVSSKKMVKK